MPAPKRMISLQKPAWKPTQNGDKPYTGRLRPLSLAQKGSSLSCPFLCGCIIRPHIVGIARFRLCLGASNGKTAGLIRKRNKRVGRKRRGDRGRGRVRATSINQAMRRKVLSGRSHRNVTASKNPGRNQAEKTPQRWVAR